MSNPPPIAGLVLSGGHSKRMQRDKAALLIDGQHQLGRAVALLRHVCADVFVSVRPDQINDPMRSQYPQVIDQIQDVGPAAGILAAFALRPDHAWLIAAVDLPLLDAATLNQLVSERNPQLMALYYLGTRKPCAVRDVSQWRSQLPTKISTQSSDSAHPIEFVEYLGQRQHARRVCCNCCSLRARRL